MDILTTEHYGKPSEELLADMLEDEIPYPVVNISARWGQNTDGKPYKQGDCPDDLPEGYQWKGTYWSELERKPRSPEELSVWAYEEWWPKYNLGLKEKEIGTNILDVEVTVEFRRWEVWCLNWFSHWTWDVGLSDSKVLESFQRFVFRTQEANLIEGKMDDGWTDKYCLMGAEDRYRWSGSADDGSTNRTDPPCRCTHCKRRGVVTINH